MNYQSKELTASIAASEAEESLIGAIVYQSSIDGGKAIQEVSQIIQPGDFKGVTPGDPPIRWATNGRIYYAMLKSDKPPHRVNLTLTMVKLGIWDIKDTLYIDSCGLNTPCSLDYLDYAKAVKEYSLQRQVKYYAEKGNLRKINEITQNKFTGGVEGL